MYRLLFSLALGVMISATTSNSLGQTIRTLPSGKQVKVLSARKLFFTKDSPALWLKYETDIDLQDRPKVEAEVQEIWRFFRVDVEKSGLTNAIISPTDKPVPRIGLIVTTSHSKNLRHLADLMVNGRKCLRDGRDDG